MQDMLCGLCRRHPQRQSVDGGATLWGGVPWGHSASFARWRVVGTALLEAEAYQCEPPLRWGLRCGSDGRFSVGSVFPQ